LSAMLADGTTAVRSREDSAFPTFDDSCLRVHDLVRLDVRDGPFASICRGKANLPD
jgi:hypothetical protein